ncbi:MAG: DUF3467 domain-containing protein [bacterium]|nr:DUF3467 domain-containing protein [bacterium]
MAQKQKQLRATIDENVVDGIYVNMANIMHSPSEFIIDFGRLVPGKAEAKILSRIISSPTHAKYLLKALEGNISAYEKTYGTIKTNEEEQRKLGF